MSLIEPSKSMSKKTYSEATLSNKLVLRDKKRKRVASDVQMFQLGGQHAVLYVRRLTNSSAPLSIDSDRPGALSQYHVFLTRE